MQWPLSVCGFSKYWKCAGWLGLGWLQGVLYTPFICSLVAAFAFTTPFLIEKKVSLKKILLATMVLYGMNLVCYRSGKFICYALYCRFCTWSNLDLLFLALAALTLFLFLGFGYWYITRSLLVKLRWIYGVYFAIAAMMVLPLSLMSVRLFPGFGNGHGLVDAVKMGYPIFWMTAILGTMGVIVARKHS